MLYFFLHNSLCILLYKAFSVRKSVVLRMHYVFMLSCFIFIFSSLFSIYFMSILFYLSYCYYTNKDRQKMSRLYFYPLSIFYRLTRQKNILSFFHILFFIIAFYKFNYYSQISWKFSLFPAYLFLSLFSF